MIEVLAKGGDGYYLIRLNGSDFCGRVVVVDDEGVSWEPGFRPVASIAKFGYWEPIEKEEAERIENILKRH